MREPSRAFSLRTIQAAFSSFLPHAIQRFSRPIQVRLSDDNPGAEPYWDPVVSLLVPPDFGTNSERIEVIDSKGRLLFGRGWRATISVTT
jgi:hypothetical protein